jgi:fused signal recognition particle receptor
MFNWFRRQIGNKQERETQPEVEENQVKESEATEATTSDAETADNDRADYLQWAKLAYKNIQERRGEGAEETVETLETPIVVEPVIETPIAEVVTPVETGKVEVEAIDEPAAIEEIVATEREEETTTETATESIVETPENPESDTLEPDTPEIVSNEVVEPESELEPVAVTVTPVESIDSPTELSNRSPEIEAETPSIAFDDEFIWSAQVLAAQGKKAEEISVEEISWLKKLRKGLDKTRRGVVNQLKAIVGQGPLTETAIGQLETLLLQADIGIDATDYILDRLQKKVKEESLASEQSIPYLKEILRGILDKPLENQASPNFAPSRSNLNIWLMTGVNGAGKTTTIGKLANLAQKSGYSCTIAAADTFRAAAVQQVKVWGERTGTPVIANPAQNTDPAAVVYDAIAASQSRKTELLLVDTAGRLQNKKNLMEELAKIRRVVDKKAPNAKVESLLVIDSSLGQNGLRQAQVFSDAAKLSGVVLTKLDGSAKGGIAIAIARQLNLPIRFIGVGEGIEDLRPFSSYEFVEALLGS